MDVSILLKLLSFLHQLACQLPLPLDEMLEVPAATATRGRGSDTRCHTCLCVCHMIVKLIPSPQRLLTPLVWADWYSIFIVSELYLNRHATSAKRVAVSLTYVARSLGLLATEQSHWIMITSRREQTHYIIAWISLWSGRDRHGCLLHWFLINYRETS